MKMTQDKVITAFPAWSGTPMMYNLGQDDQGLYIYIYIIIIIIYIIIYLIYIYIYL